MSATFFYFYQYLLIFVYSNYCNFRIGFVSILSGENQDIGQQVQSGANVALFEINNNAQILPNCTISAIIEDSKGIQSNAVHNALNLLDVCLSNDSFIKYINVPIIVGAQSSELSQSLNPVLTSFDTIQISAASTSISLSSSSYNRFNRLIASDTVQARGIIEICRQFNWYKIGVLYINSNYGIYFVSKLTEYAIIYNISVIEYSYNHDIYTIDQAVALLSNSNILITLLICHPNELQYIVKKLNEYKRWQYPYYYFGVDSWINGNYINIKNYSFNGYIGTCPWNPTYYTSSLYSLYIQESAAKYRIFSKLWYELYHDKTSDVEFYNTSTDIPGLFASYSYDLIYLIAHSIKKYIDDVGIDINDIISVHSFNATKLQHIMRSLSFIGITGNVSLNHINGDRENGLLGICNVENNKLNTIRSIGFFHLSDDDDDFTFYLDKESILWPINFTKREINPQSTEIVIPVIGEIDRAAFWILSVVISSISFLLCIFYIILLYLWSNKPIIKAMSWRLTILMCFGCLIAYIVACLYGIDEFYVKEYEMEKWEFLCNFRLCILHFGITLGFAPLFAKTYRISRIFNIKRLDLYIIKDQQLFLVIGALLMVDIILLILMIAVGRLHREYTISTMNGSNDDKYLEKYQFEYMSDPLYVGQIQFGSCEHIDSNGLYFLMIISIFKMLMFCYGLFIAITVIRVPGKKFNDSFEIIVSVILASSLMIIVTPLQIFVPVSTTFGMNFRYCSMVGSILIATNVGIAALVLPRFIAIYRKKEDEYTKSDIEKERELRKKYRMELTQKLLLQQRFNTVSPNGDIKHLLSKQNSDFIQTPFDDLSIEDSKLFTNTDADIDDDDTLNDDDDDDDNDDNDDIITQSVLNNHIEFDRKRIDSVPSTETFSSTTNESIHLELAPYHHMSPISEHAELEHTTNSEFTFKKDRGNKDFIEEEDDEDKLEHSAKFGIIEYDEDDVNNMKIGGKKGNNKNNKYEMVKSKEGDDDNDDIED